LVILVKRTREQFTPKKNQIALLDTAREATGAKKGRNPTV